MGKMKLSRRVRTNKMGGGKLSTCVNDTVRRQKYEMDTIRWKKWKSLKILLLFKIKTVQVSTEDQLRLHMRSYREKTRSPFKWECRKKIAAVRNSNFPTSWKLGKACNTVAVCAGGKEPLNMSSFGVTWCRWPIRLLRVLATTNRSGVLLIDLRAPGLDSSGSVALGKTWTACTSGEGGWLHDMDSHLHVFEVRERETDAQRLY